MDISDYACAFARENAVLNGLQDRVRFEEANVFDLLSQQSRDQVKYDTIILDPPAFTKTRAAIPAAARGYKEINLRAMKMLEPGGFLITCSCSQHILPDHFKSIILDAAMDAHVHLRQVEFRLQGKETCYLKCGIYQVFPQ